MEQREPWSKKTSSYFLSVWKQVKYLRRKKKDFYECSICMYTVMPEEGTRFHCKGLLGMDLRSAGPLEERPGSALKHSVILPAPHPQNTLYSSQAEDTVIHWLLSLHKTLNLTSRPRKNKNGNFSILQITHTSYYETDYTHKYEDRNYKNHRRCTGKKVTPS